jgi:flagellar FliL protein
LKANPKMKADPKADPAAAAPAGAKKKLIVIAAAAVLLLGSAGGAAWYVMQGDAAGQDSSAETKKKDPGVKPEYVQVESFTVNLQPENGEQYLQVQFTLQVAGTEQATLIKDNMAIVRNRVLLLLSGKRASEISTVGGKQQLAAEIQAIVQEPFEKDGAEQEVTDVLFTSFIIQ